MKNNLHTKNSSQFEITLLYPETNKETIISKSYVEYWKSAMKKIRIYLILKRFSKPGNTDYTDFFESFKSPEPEKLRKFDSLVLTDSKIFNPIGNFYLFWLFILIASSLYLTTYSIFLASFQGSKIEAHEVALEFAIEIIFFLDILVMLNLATFDEDGVYVYKRSQIFLRYLKGYFFLDLVSGVPIIIISLFLPQLVSSNFFIFRHIFKLTKWVKIIRKIDLITFIKVIDYVYIKYKNIIDLLLLFSIFLFTAHVFGCLFFLASRVHKFEYDTWPVKKKNLLDQGSFIEYLSSLYWATTTFATVGYGDIVPYSENEVLVCLTWMLIGMVILSYTVGRSSTVFSRMLKKDIILDLLMAKVDEYAKVYKIPKTLKNKIKVSIRSSQIIKYDLTINSVVLELEQSLRYTLALSIYKGAITKIPFFYKKSVDFISNFTFLLEFLCFDKNDCLWLKNCSSDGIYFIISGRAKYYHNGTLFFIYQEGGFFGDTEVFIKSQRKFDVFVSNLFKCFKLSIEKLRYLKENYPIYFQELVSLRKTRTQNLIQSLAQMRALQKHNSLETLTLELVKKYEIKLKKKLFKNSQYVELEKIKKIRRDLIEFNKTRFRVKGLLESASRYL